MSENTGVGKRVALVSSYPHALKAGQRSQWPQRSQRSQGLDGRKVRVAQGVSYQANQRNLMEEMTGEEQLKFCFAATWVTSDGAADREGTVIG